MVRRSRRGGGGLAEVATSEFRIHAREPTGYYRPVVLLSLLVDLGLSGVFPWIFHFTNAALHALNAVLVFSLFGSIARSGRAALCGGLLFAVHPVHVESVAFVSGRTDLWACLFVLVASLFWVLRRRSHGGSQVVAASSGAVAFGLGALAKEATLLLPAPLLAWDALTARRHSGATWWRRSRAWLAAFAAALGVVHSRTGRYREALLEFDRALRLEPDFASAHFNLAILYVKLGDPRRANERLAIRRDLDPVLADRLAEVLRRAGF